jgi:hypothetical protein
MAKNEAEIIAQNSYMNSNSTEMPIGQSIGWMQWNRETETAERALKEGIAASLREYLI